jgi:hypothetical protein
MTFRKRSRKGSLLYYAGQCDVSTPDKRLDDRLPERAEYGVC